MKLNGHSNAISRRVKNVGSPGTALLCKNGSHASLQFHGECRYVLFEAWCMDGGIHTDTGLFYIAGIEQPDRHLSLKFAY